jgi:hypothetical protein
MYLLIKTHVGIDTDSELTCKAYILDAAELISALIPKVEAIFKNGVYGNVKTNTNPKYGAYYAYGELESGETETFTIVDVREAIRKGYPIVDMEEGDRW